MATTGLVVVATANKQLINSLVLSVILIMFNSLQLIYADNSIITNSVVCSYYSPTNQSVIEQTTCQYACCSSEGQVAHDLDHTCCNNGSKWWISLIVIFSIIFLCCLVISYACTHYWCRKSMKKRERQREKATANKNGTGVDRESTAGADDDGRRSSTIFRPSSFGQTQSNVSATNLSRRSSLSSSLNDDSPISRRGGGGVGGNNAVHSSINNIRISTITDQLPNYEDLLKKRHSFAATANSYEKKNRAENDDNSNRPQSIAINMNDLKPPTTTTATSTTVQRQNDDDEHEQSAAEATNRPIFTIHAPEE